MKKIIGIITILLVVLLVGCTNWPDIQNEITPSTIGTTEVEDTTTFASTSPPHTTAEIVDVTTYPKSYIPGSIKLHDGPMGDMIDFPVTHRFIWYEIQGSYADLVDLDAYNSWEYPPHVAGEEPTEMLYVAFVKYFNINKLDFIRVTEEERKLSLKLGKDITEESFELPNPDIIYTFDDDIINEYYRRE
jgi:hypothetical protein